MLKVIFIDVDDTLLSFDEYVKNVMKVGFKKFGLTEYKEEMYKVFEEINDKLWEDLEKNLITFEQIKQTRWNLIFKALNIDFDGITFEKYFRQGILESAISEEGAIELLEYLSKKYILCIASNGPFAQQINRLKKAGMDKYFKYFFMSQDMGASKPSKEFFDLCFEKICTEENEKILPSETMIIGDSITSDIIGGYTYGMKTCFYNKKHKKIDKELEIDYQVFKLKQIINII